ncbi:MULTISPECIES: aquaporin Z [unclassified Okeania]|uniref:aquaporin Z n=1 Tax=unclassified Okeania TaxID=2634635 RepID=UPI00338E2CD0
MQTKKLIAEAIGTFVLVFGGCGSAVFAANFPEATQNTLGIALLGVSLAFGLTVLTMAYAVGHISGGHFNPAVTFGLYFGKRFSGGDILPYILAQLVGAVFGALTLYLIATGKSGFDISAGALASNGFGEHSPGEYSLLAGFIAEFVLTFIFLIIILGSTDRRAPGGFAPVPIGLGLTLVHLIGIPVTNLSVNPARSTGPAIISAIFGSVSWPIAQLWLFWIAPRIGAITAGFVYSTFLEEAEENIS